MNKTTYSAQDTSIILSFVMQTKKNNTRMILSKYSAAIFWGFSPLLTRKLYVTVPKCYHVQSDNFDVSYRNKDVIDNDIINFTFEDRVVKITTLEKTFVDLIKEFKNDYNDHKTEIIKNFFNSTQYNKDYLYKLSKESNVFEIIKAFEAAYVY